MAPGIPKGEGGVQYIEPIPLSYFLHVRVMSTSKKADTEVTVMYVLRLTEVYSSAYESPFLDGLPGSSRYPLSVAWKTYVNRTRGQ
ncbi:hypothetical protein QCA50_003910 [Cerrena zonata]|uniref:Uncharacterized protein n=1 Tax=Cerrena zonata TaxID=2478898 RepID=A0AAW0GMH7_9APHY